MRALDALGFDSIREFIEQRAEPEQWYRTDATPLALGTSTIISKLSRVTKSDEAEGPDGLPCVHRVINALKAFIMGTYFGVSAKYLPGYLNEFCFRFIRRESNGTTPQMPASRLPFRATDDVR